MDFLKTVFLAILIHIVAPLVVRHVEANHPINSVYETQHGGGKPDNSGMNR